MCSPSQPTQQTVSSSELPEWAKPYAQETLAKGQALTAQPYQTYNAPRIAGFTDLQQTAQQQAAGMAPAEQLGTATGLAQAAGMMGLGAQYQPGYFRNQFRAPGQYQPGQFSMLQAEAPELTQYQMGGPERVGTQSYTGENVGQYMSPYMQNVVDVQQQEAKRQSDILGTQLAGQATQAGAFGGSRYGLQEAERQRNLATQLGQIQATGSQAAFQNAQQQFNQQQQANLQAQLANQQAGLTAGGQNLQALLGVQQLGAGQNLQAQLANQQMLQAAQQAAEQSRQYGYGQGMTGAQLGAQYGLAAQQLGEQSRQFGAGLGLQGLGTSLQAAGTLGNLGQTQYGQQMGINQLLNQYGTQQQALQQQGLSQAYQDFLNQQNYPYKQLGFMSDLIRGLPLGQQTTQQVYQAPPTALQTAGSLGLGAYGLKQLGMFAEGGAVGYADGGSVTSEEFVKGALDKLSDQQLAQAERIAVMNNDQQRLQDIAEEKATRASERGGLAGAFNQLSPQVQAALAAGGIVAFAGDDEENDPQTGQLVSDESPGAPALYQQALADTLKYGKAIGDFKGTALTQDELNDIIQKRYAMEQRLAGPNPYGQFEKYIAEAEAARPQAIQEAKGLGALQAMGAITQPGGFIRGLGAAGSAFGSTVAKAKEADRVEKRALASMQLNLADAQRKERMGMTRSAIDAATQAQRDRLAADKAHIAKLQAQGTIAGKAAQAARPTAQRSAGQPKLNEQLAAAEIAFENNPTEANLRNVTALRRATAQAKTTDVGGTRESIELARIQSGEDAKALEARTNAQYTGAYLQAKTPAEKKAVLDNAEREARQVFRNQNKAGKDGVIKLD